MIPRETRTNRRKSHKPLAFLGALLLLSISSILLEIDLTSPFSTSYNSLRRSLLTTSKHRYLAHSHSALLPYAHHNLRSIADITRDPSEETALFWHIPKSGGTTAKRIYECFGKTLANRIGADPKYGLDKTDEVVVFSPFQKSNHHAKFVNVDTTSKDGILRAERLGLVPSKKVDMIFTSDLNFASDHLFDRNYRGRILALFRHPVDRLVSKFYYLQTATWEKTYSPEWKDMTLLEWAEKHNKDENLIVKKIVGKGLGDSVDLGDLIVAREIVHKSIVVGLMDDMEESIRRFNVVMGIDVEGDMKNRQCMEEFFGKKDNSVVEKETKDGGAQQLKKGGIKKENGANKVAAAAVNKKQNGRGLKDGEQSREEGKKPDVAANKPSNNFNSNAHPKVEEGSPEWEILADRNHLDMILYDYIKLLYRKQERVINKFALERKKGLILADAAKDE